MSTTSQKKVGWVFLLIALLAAAGITGLQWVRYKENGASRHHLEILKLLPRSTTAVATGSLQFFYDKAFEQLLVATGIDLDTALLRQELGDLLVQRVGIDPLKVRHVTVFESEGLAGVLLETDEPFLPPNNSESKTEGLYTLTKLTGDLWVLPLDGSIALGFPPVLKSLVEVRSGERPSLDSTPAGELHREIVAELGNSVVVASFAPSEEMNRELLEPLLPGGKIQGAGASLTSCGETSLAVKADAGTREMLVKKFEMGETLVREKVRTAKDNLANAGLGEGVAVIFANRHLDWLVETVRPRESGEFLRLDFERDDAGAMILAVVLSTVGAPAYIKYMRRAKTTEAIDMMDKIYKGAAEYYITPRADRNTWERLPCQFPKSVGPTPAQSCCSPEVDSDGDGRCDWNPEAWMDASWSALKFAINEPHQFVYEFESKGEGPDAEFTIRAYGDLDCDGIRSTFERRGYVEAGASPGECGGVRQYGGMYIERETE